MKKNILVAAVVTLMTGSVMAAGAFDGVNAQLGVGFGQLSSTSDSSTTNYVDTTPGYNFNSRSTQTYNTAGNANIFGNISLGYSYGFSNKLNLAANMFYLGGSSNAGTNNYLSTNTDGYVASGSNNVTLKNIFGIVLEPGYYFGEKTLGFLKAGVAQGTVGVSGFQYLYNPDNGNQLMSNNYNASSNVQGVLYGLGFKQMVTDQVYVGVEAYQIQFASKTFSNTYTDTWGKYNSSQTIKPLASFAGITVGYKF